VGRRLSQLIALWFVMQIVVPFTAPLQTLDLRDFLGKTKSHTAQRTPESSTTPTIREASAASGLASLATSMATAVGRIAGTDAAESAPRRPGVRPLPALPGQRTILRL
jgi:hypothetical protein